MERCKAPGNIGEFCRRIDGTDQKACFYQQAAELEPVIGLRSFVGNVQPGCPFRKEVVSYIAGRLIRGK